MLVLANWPTTDKQVIHRRQQLIQQILEKEPDYLRLGEKLEALRRYEPKVAEIYDHSSLFNSEQIQEKIQWYADQGVIGRVIQSSVLGGFLKNLGDLLVYSGYFSLVYSNIERPYCSCSHLFRWGVTGINLMMLYSGKYIADLVEEYLKNKDKATGQVLKEYLEAVYYYLRQVFEIQLIDDLPESLKIQLADVEHTRILDFHEQLTEWVEADDEQDLQTALFLMIELSELKDTLVKIIYETGRMDLFLAIASQMHSSRQRIMQNSDANVVTFAHFRDQGPYLEVEGFWNPMLNASQAVSNNLRLGGANSDENNVCGSVSACEAAANGLLLSGNNASGKSTLMRAVTLNAVFLAQTLGIAAAHSYEASIFYAANSYMDKYDKTGSSSSYMEELRYVSELFKEPDDLKGKPRLVCFDELFSTTDSDDGKQGFELVLNAISGRRNLLTLISTHYETEDFGVLSGFAVRHMAMSNETGKLRPTYQLAKGHKNHTVALDLLAEHFQSELPEVAEKIRAYQRDKL